MTDQVPDRFGGNSRFLLIKAVVGDIAHALRDGGLNVDIEWRLDKNGDVTPNFKFRNSIAREGRLPQASHVSPIERQGIVSTAWEAAQKQHPCLRFEVWYHEKINVEDTRDLGNDDFAERMRLRRLTDGR